MPKQLSVRLDVRRLLNDLPFPLRELGEHFQRFGFPPIGKKGIRRWYESDSITGERLAAVLAIAEYSGKRLDVNDYVVVDQGEEEIGQTANGIAAG